MNINRRVFSAILFYFHNWHCFVRHWWLAGNLLYLRLLQITNCSNKYTQTNPGKIAFVRFYFISWFFCLYNSGPCHVWNKFRRIDASRVRWIGCGFGFMEDSQCQWPHVLQKLFSYVKIGFIGWRSPTEMTSFANERQNPIQIVRYAVFLVSPKNSHKLANSTPNDTRTNAHLQYAEIIRISICSSRRGRTAHTQPQWKSEDRNNHNQNNNIYVKLIFWVFFGRESFFFFRLKWHLEKAG